MAEVCLDLMDSFDLARIIGESPCPLIITCRPPREGGKFVGSESDRLDVLWQAAELGCSYVDVEWDSIDKFPAYDRTDTRVIVSRHWLDGMPEDLSVFYDDMCGQTDVIKLVGLANHPVDMLPVFELLRHARGPVIGLAMGEAGVLTRLLAPCFSHCLLTYAAASATEATAPGQLSVQAMTQKYNLQSVGPNTAVRLHLCSDAASAEAVVARNAAENPGELLHVPLVAEPPAALAVVAALRRSLPRLLVTADAEMALVLREMEELNE
jgi:3-dehydroquinate dehydratase/shikimate dehydrogenase